CCCFFFQAEDGIRDFHVTGVQTCALPIFAAMSVPLAVLLAIVAARVVGTTGIPPIGAIGKLSQLAFGAMAPGQVAINLMSANSAGGAAGQATDLLNDFKVGNAIGASQIGRASCREGVESCAG